MPDRLYGRAHAVRITRDVMSRVNTAESPDGTHHPVVIYEGCAGSGKTALLEALAGLFEQRLPYAYLDLKQVEDRLQGAPTPQLLAALAFQLARRCPGYGALRFPRLVIGHLVMRLELDQVDRAVARGQVTAALQTHRGLDRAKNALPDAARAILANVPGTQIVDPAPLINRLLGVGFDRLASWGPLRRPFLGPYQAWYGHQDRDMTGPAEEVLVDLNYWASRSSHSGNQERIDDLLFNAFLADLRADFAGDHQAARRSFNCAVLLDNADTRLGQSFLAKLVQIRRNHLANGLTTADPLTVIAASRGSLLSSLTDQGAISSVGESDGQEEPDHDDARRTGWWLRHRLSDLTFDEVEALVSTKDLRSGNTHRLAMMIHQFTGGHPAGTRDLLTSVTDGRTASVELAEVLQIRRGAGLTVEEGLAKRLLKGITAASVDELAICAAARNKADAKAMALHLGLTDLAVNDVLTAGLWRADQVDEPTLMRRLLLRRLSRQAAPDPQNWVAAHGWLRTRAATSGETESELYYALAGGEELIWVAKILAKRLATDEISAWLHLIHAVTRAPRRAEASDPRPPGVVAGELSAGVDSRDQPFAAVLRLVAAQWVVGDPLCGSDRSNAYSKIASALADVSRHLDGESDELDHEVRKYHHLADLWHNH